MKENRLAREQSPYLLQHKQNPVDWFPWGAEAFEKARREDKPIFLSIGYATCHWCHVMERESFESETVAAVMNEHFVAIKVDREERPDIDKIYMTAVQSMTGQGGWPLSVFLTPELEPFYGGTYFPPEGNYGRPGFRQLLQKVHESWTARAPELRKSAASMAKALREMGEKTRVAHTEQEPEFLLRNAAEQFKAEFDEKDGGFGGAPKFPRPSLPIFLARFAEEYSDPQAAEMVATTCRAMIRGGIHDQIGGGFHRYSVDEKWLVPHFEKMLYDNAQLISLFSEIHRLQPDPVFEEAVARTHVYLMRDMRHSEGGFFSAEDADSEGREGLFYCWTRAEFEKLLTSEEFALACRIFGVTEGGNFHDHSDPNPLPGLNVLSLATLPKNQKEEKLLSKIREKLLATRAKRPRPLLDDKVLTSWNALLISGYAHASIAFNKPEYALTAMGILNFIDKHLTDPATGRLSHRWRNGHRDKISLLEDHAFLLAALVDLYECTLDAAHLHRAKKLAGEMIHLFHDEKNGAFWQRAEGDDLIARVKDEYDGAEPSGNSVAIVSLLRLGELLDDAALRKIGKNSLAHFSQYVAQLPSAVPYLLNALILTARPPLQAVLTGDISSPRTRELLETFRRLYLPNAVLVRATLDHPTEFFRSLASEKPALHLCENGSCKLPVTSSSELIAQLRKLPAKG